MTSRGKGRDLTVGWKRRKRLRISSIRITGKDSGKRFAARGADRSKRISKRDVLCALQAGGPRIGWRVQIFFLFFFLNLELVFIVNNNSLTRVRE